MNEPTLTDWLLGKIQDCTKTIRSIEDLASKVSIDLTGDCAYNSIVAYRAALNDVLAEKRRIDDRRKGRATI